MTVVGTYSGDRFVPSEVILPSPPQSASVDRLPPLGVNLLDRMEPRVFGVEERVSVRNDGGVLIVECRSGSKPAGVTLSPQMWRLPRFMDGKLVIKGVAESDFGVALTARGEDANREATLNTGAASVLEIPSSQWPENDVASDLVILCAPEAGAARIASVSIDPESTSAPQFSTWIWDIGPWLETPEALIAALEARNVRRVFIQLPITDGSVSNRTAVLELLSQLKASGISALAVEGDPAMTTPEGRDHALVRASAISGFRNAGAQLEAVQYDIEPYLRAGFSADAAAGWEAWSTTIEALSAEIGQEIDAVVPFWMLGSYEGERALSLAKTSISGVTVMAYRTNIDELEQIAADWLEWGAENGIGVSIALERGPISPEEHRTYLLAEFGDLILDQSGPSAIASLEAKARQAGPFQSAYSFGYKLTVDPARITFRGQDQMLNAVIEHLRSKLAGWRSFQGLSVHALIDLPR